MNRTKSDLMMRGGCALILALAAGTAHAALVPPAPPEAAPHVSGPSAVQTPIAGPTRLAGAGATEASGSGASMSGLDWAVSPLVPAGAEAGQRTMPIRPMTDRERRELDRRLKAEAARRVDMAVRSDPPSAALRRRAGSEAEQSGTPSGGSAFPADAGVLDPSPPEARPGDHASGADEGVASGVNWRGQRPFAAPTRYFMDFEDGVVRPEWSLSGGLETMAPFGTFAGPFRQASQAVNLKVEPGESYTLKFDLYLIARSLGDPLASNVFSVQVDGQTVFENTFAELQAINRAADGAKPGFDESIVRAIKANFRPERQVAEIVWSVRSAGRPGGETWGLDNVLVETDPGPTFGARDDAEVPWPGGAGSGNEPGGASPGPGGGGGGGGGDGGGGGGGKPRPKPTPPESKDEPKEPDPPKDEPKAADDPPTPPPPPKEPPVNPPPPPPPPEPPVPAPGTVGVMLIGGSMVLRRRRRD
ncbi:MAG: PEP-CTERM sorting domain-containing protein [Phycisphaerales bacterium]|nr:PEP-CTERM sorting domain-containing protein [Phycisphaerales bacterium]